MEQIVDITGLYNALIGTIFFLFCFLIALLFAYKKSKYGFWILCFISLLHIYLNYRNNLDSYFSFEKCPSTFDELVKNKKWPLQVDSISVNKNKYIEVIVFPSKFISFVRLTSLRSGMPAYVFDTKGRLVDNTLDHHDEVRYQDKWERPELRKTISINEAYKIIGEIEEQRE